MNVALREYQEREEVVERTVRRKRVIHKMTLEQQMRDRDVDYRSDNRREEIQTEMETPEA